MRSRRSSRVTERREATVGKEDRIGGRAWTHQPVLAGELDHAASPSMGLAEWELETMQILCPRHLSVLLYSMSNHIANRRNWRPPMISRATRTMVAVGIPAPVKILSAEYSKPRSIPTIRKTIPKK